MLQWLENLGTWLSSVFDPLIEFFKSVIHGFSVMIKMIPQVSSLVYRCITYLPSFFAVFITITISIYIIYLIVGRDPGD